MKAWNLTTDIHFAVKSHSYYGVYFKYFGLKGDYDFAVLIRILFCHNVNETLLHVLKLVPSYYVAMH